MKIKKSQSKLVLFLVLFMLFSLALALATTEPDTILNSFFEEKLTTSNLTKENLSSEVIGKENKTEDNLSMNIEFFENNSFEKTTNETVFDEETVEFIQENLTETSNTSEILEEIETEKLETEPDVNKSKEIQKTNITEKIFEEIIQKNKHKFNQETEQYLTTIEDKKEEKEFIIKYNYDFDKTKLKNFSELKNLKKFRISKFKAKTEDIQEILGDENVEYLELDQELKIFSEIVPFNVKQINADSVWNKSKGSGIKVAILDTGIVNHDDLKIAGGWNVLTNSSDYTDTDGHGTSIVGVVASIINNKGLIGVSPEVEVYAVKIIDYGSGYLSDAILGVEWAIENEIDIISMSFGYYGYSQIFKEVIEEAYNEGLLLVGASGNDNFDYIIYPAAYSKVIAVGAVDSNNEKAVFSNYGFELELVAPGVKINTTSISGYNIFSGTSLAVPHVVGVASLIWSNNKSLSNEQVRGKLRNDALDLGNSGKDDYYGYGLVQADLGSSNYNYTPDNYFYEIFNVTDYGLLNESLSFWLNGTGTIDDVSFSEGIYFIIKNLTSGISKKYYNVSKNGTLKLLAYVDFNDDFTSDNSLSSDGKAWKNGILQVKLGNIPSYLDAQCYDYDGDGDYEECFYDDIGAYSACSSYSSGLSGGDGRAFYDVCENRPNDCNEGANGDSNNFQSISTSSINYDSVYISYWRDCDDPLDHDWGYENGNFYIFDKRKTICQSASQVKYYGRYTSSPSWIDYKTKNCPSNKECDYSADEQETTSKTANIDPCRLKNGESCTSTPQCLTGVSCISGICGGPPTPKCNGTINVVTSGSGLNVKINGSYKGTTDELYFWSEDIEDSATCGTAYNVSVYCNDNTTLCYSEITYFSENDELVTVVDSDCDKTCSADKNFWITNKDVDVSGNDVNVTVHSADLSGTVNVTLFSINEVTGLIDGNKTESVVLSSKSSAKLSTTFDLGSASAMNIYVDKDNYFPADDKQDNFVYRVIVKDKPDAYLSINTSYPEIDSLIKTYLKQYIVSVSENNADLIISIGKNTQEFTLANPETLKPNGMWWWKEQGWGFEPQERRITAYGKKDSAIYGGLVGRTEHPTNGKPLILAYGIAHPAGDITAVKKIIAGREIFLMDLDDEEKPPLLIDKYDTQALGINSILQGHTNYSTPTFLKKINKILFDNIYDVTIRPVKTLDQTSYSQNTTLRVKNVNADYTQDFKDAITEHENPVVLAHGIHSDLLTWEDFGKDLAQAGHDTWLIEAYGGPTTEDCTYGCPNYTFADLKNYFWPALIAGVQKYSGKNNLSYVGYDLGCTMALESLENFGSGDTDVGYYFDYTTGQYKHSNLTANPIETFIGIGCIGNFTGLGYENAQGEVRLPYYLQFIAANRNIYNNPSSLTNLIFNKHIPSNYHVSPPYYMDDLKEGSQYFLNKIIAEGSKYITGSIKSTILSAVVFANTLFDAKMPSLVGHPISVEIFNEFNELIYRNKTEIIGNNVNLSNMAIIQSTYDASMCWKGNILQEYSCTELQHTDNFIFDIDQKNICKNINSNNKYYIGFSNIPHFGSFFNKGLADKQAVHKVITDFLEDGQIIQQPTYYTILSEQSDCE